MSEPSAALSTVFTYFNPSRSPYYTIGLAACFSVTYVSDVHSTGLWLTLAIPAFAVAVLTFFLSLDGQNMLKQEEQAEQLRFARSTCISVAVLALAFAGKETSESQDIVWFATNAAICCFQIVLFLVYHWALNKKETLASSNRNYVQITLLTSAFLGDTSYNLAAATKTDPQLHHAWTAGALALLWLSCIVFWVKKLTEIVVRPGETTDARGLGTAAGG